MAISERWLDNIANNLANASTVGFKRETLAFNERLMREMRAQLGTGEVVGSLGSGPELLTSAMVMEQGAAVSTGNPLDVAILGDKGFFAVQSAEGVRYTRNGSFNLSPDRTLITKSGQPVLDTQNQPITLPEGKAEISEFGEVKVNGQTIAQLGIVDGAFSPAGYGLYSGASTLPMESVQLMTAALESSNVNAIDEMVQMVKLNRAFEMSQKSASSQDEATERLIQSLNSR